MHLTIDCSAHRQIISVFMKWSYDVCILSANESMMQRGPLPVLPWSVFNWCWNMNWTMKMYAD